jgi:hypothetical protein
MPVLEAPAVYDLAVDELLEEMGRFESQYGLSTTAFLRRRANEADSLDDISDADIWYSAWIGYIDITMGTAEPPPDAMEQTVSAEEGSKEPSSHFRFERLPRCGFLNMQTRLTPSSRISAGWYPFARSASGS